MLSLSFRQVSTKLLPSLRQVILKPSANLPTNPGTKYTTKPGTNIRRKTL
ncbi:MAG: hypothetical protein JWO08_1938 [Verrucomicrobiaceae bacterium]|nr:hypothetical protein [Verrucomicrobiaceae bacterium]